MKYINIIDLRDFDCYQNVNCRLLYLELCSRMDVKTRNVTFSQRGIERDLPMTYAAIRHALALLVRDGLVAQLSAQEIAQEGARGMTQRTTHLHIMSFSELSDASDASYNASGNASGNAISDAENNAPMNKGKKKNLNNKIIITLPRAREILNSFDVKKISMYLDVSEYHGSSFVGAFLGKMEIKNRSWSDENDLISHFLDWSTKNKKQVLARAEQEQSAEEAAPMTAPEEAPHPAALTPAEWNWICRIVASGQAAPAVLEEYKKGCHELGVIPTYAL